MVKKCSIVFENNPVGIYYSGEEVELKIQLEFSKPKSVRGLYVRLLGKGYFQYNNWRGIEYLIDRKKYFCGGNGGKYQMQPGLYEASCSFKLPEQLPTSMFLIQKSIRYEVIVGLDNRFWFDKKFGRELFIIKALDLNCEPEYRSPVAAEKIQKLCPFFSPKLIAIKAHIPRAGYIPHEEISISIEINNDTNLRATLSAELIQYIILHSKQVCNTRSFGKTKSVVKRIIINGESQPNTMDKFQCTMIVPLIVPSNDNMQENMCTTRYELKIAAKVNGFYLVRPVVKIPITIGTTGFSANCLNLSERTDIIETNFRARYGICRDCDPSLSF